MVRNMEAIKIGMSAVTGRVFNVKRKMVGEHKIQEFGLGISKKNKDGSYSNGFLNVTLWGDTKVEDRQDVGLLGRLEPEEYTKQDGTKVTGIRFNANEVFTPAKWESKGQAPKQEEDDKPW